MFFMMAAVLMGVVFMGVVFMGMVVMIVVFMFLVVAAAMFLLVNLVECFIPTFVHQPSTEQCREQGCYRSHDGERQTHE